MNSRAQVLIDRGEFGLREVELRELGAGQVRIRTHACGICGSDKVLAQTSAPGTILGHEVVGEVEACGAGVDGLRVGDRVVPLGDGLGMSKDRGGFSERFLIAASACVRVPESITSRAAVLAEPLGNGLHFVRRGRLQPGQLVAILGAGQIGLSILFWARRLGASRIVVSEPAPARAALARELGADAVVDPTQVANLGVAIADALGGRPQVVFEAVGKTQVMDQAIRLPGGRGSTIVLAGISTDTLNIHPAALCMKETDLIFPIGTVAEEVAEVLEVMATGGIPTEKFVSHRIAQDEIPQAIAALGTPTDQIKVVVEYA